MCCWWQIHHYTIHSLIGEKTFEKAKKLETVKKKSLIKNQTEFSEIKQSIKINQNTKRKEKTEREGTLIDGFDKGLDVALSAKNKRGLRDGGRRWWWNWIGGIWIDGDPSRIVASIFQTAEAIEENLKNIPPLFVHIVIQIRKYSTHSSSPSLSISLFFFFFFFSLLLPLLLLRNLKREREEWTGGTNLTFWLSFFLFLGFSRNKYGNFFNKRKWDFVCRLVGWVSVFQSVTNRVDSIDKHPSFFFLFNCWDKHPFNHLFSNFK